MANWLSQMRGVDVSSMDRGIAAREQADTLKRQGAVRNALSTWALNRTPQNRNALFVADPETGLRAEQMEREEQINTATILQGYMERAANSPNPAEAWKQAKRELVEVHNLPNSMQLPEWGPGTEALYAKAKEEAEKFGQPQAVRDTAGKPVLAQFGNRGGVRPVSGYLPPEESPEKPTMAQQANNEEVLAARDRVMQTVANAQRPGETMQDTVRRLSTKTSDTGRDNPEFNSLIERDFRLASQRLIGGDPGFNVFLSRLNVQAPAPKPESEPAEASVETDERGLADRVLSFIGLGDEPTEKPAQAKPARRPDGVSNDQIIQQARDALVGGADRNAVVERLRGWGIDPRGL